MIRAGIIIKRANEVSKIITFNKEGSNAYV